MKRARPTARALFARYALPTLSASLLLALTLLAPSAPSTFALAGEPITLRMPRALALFALLPLFPWFALRSESGLAKGRRTASTALRCASLALIALALAQPLRRALTRSTSTVFVVDVSDSSEERALADAQRFLDRALHARKPGQHVALVTFAREARAVPLAGASPALPRNRDGSATNLERALALAHGLHLPDATPQFVLFSDARETEGNAGRALARMPETRLFVAPVPSSEVPDVAVQALRAPRELAVGESFELRAELYARVPTRVRARLFAAGAPNAPDAEQTLALPRGETTLRFRSLAPRAGAIPYRLELLPEGPDRFAANNRFERTLSVRGPPRVLYVERTREEAAPLAALLTRAGFDVEVRTGEAAPRRAEQLADVDFYLLSDVPAATLGASGMEAIAHYIRSGGGFLMAGGEHAFGPGGYQGSALEPLLPISLAGTLRRDEPTLALVLALDKSGSMAGEKLERAKEAALATAELLGDRQYLGVIGFDAQPERVVRLAIASQKSSIARSVRSLAAGGGTALFPALDAAYTDLTGVRARIKHVVLLTDGQSQEESLDALVRSMRADAITVSAIGLGDDVNRGLLEALARAGGGRAYFTRDPARVPRLFTEETALVARAPLVERTLRARRVGAADFLRDSAIEQAPALGGLVATSARAAPSELLLATHEGEPLLARLRVGRGVSLAFTSDLKARWSADWYRWPGLPQLLARLVREHMRRDRSEVLPIAATLELGELHAVIDVLDAGAEPRFVNGLRGELTVSGAATRSLPLNQTAPGRYEARARLEELGSYTLEAQLDDGDRFFLARGDAAQPFPPEYALGAHQGEALREFSALARALPLPEPARLLAGPAEPARRARSARELWPALLWLALAAFLLDVAVRRVPLRSLRRLRAIFAPDPRSGT